MDIWKVNAFNLLNEEVEEFTSSWSQNLVNLRSPSYLKQKKNSILFFRCKHIYYIFSFSFGHGDVFLI